MSEVENIKEVEQVKEEVKDPVLSKIDSLKMSDDMKDKMRFIHAHYTGKKLGCPVYDVKGMNTNWKMFSFIAFLFGPLYYLVKGMWGKAIFIAALVIITAISLGAAEIYMGIVMPQAFGFIWYIYAAYNAYRDIYRKEVLNEKFWW